MPFMFPASCCRTTCALLLFVGWLPALAQSGGSASDSAAAAKKMTPSANGDLIIDQRARVAWSRCVEGMRWDGKTCTGNAALFSYKEAQALIKQRNQAESMHWRLPRVNELRRLVNRSVSPPTIIDPNLFPAAPADWHWTGTASVNATAVNPYAYGNVMRGGAGGSTLAVQQGWAVDMATGQANGEINRSEKLVLRLIRPAP